MSGGLSRQGRQAFDGIRLWASYANEHGGIEIPGEGRRPVRLLYYDDESRAAQAAANVRRLFERDRVDIVLGPYSSGLALAAAAVAEEHGKILWNHGGASDEIFARGYRCLVGVSSPASDYFRDLPRWLAWNEPGLRRLSVIHSSRGTFARQVARGLAEAAEEAGTLEAELLPMEAAPAPFAAVVLAGSFEEEVRLVRAFFGRARVVAAVAAGVRAFGEELGPLAEGIAGPSQWEPEARFPGIAGPSVEWFEQAFLERFGRAPEYTAAGAFAAGLVAAECIRRAGSLEDARLREAAAELDFHTFYGRFRIDPATGRQTGHRVLLTRWKGGRKTLLETEPV